MADEERRADDIDGSGIGWRFDPAARALIAHHLPRADAAVIDADWLRQHLAAAGWGSLRVVPDALALLLNHQKRGTPVPALRLAEAVDARVALRLSDDGMQALLDITPPQGGEWATVAMVEAALRDAGISEGIDRDALVTACELARTGGGVRDVVIAHGRPAADGDDGRLERLLPEARERKPRIDVSGQADYRDLGEIVVVHPGTPLMRRHLPTPGVPGRALDGRVIPAHDGKTVMFSNNLPGTQIDANDPDLLLAAISGMPVEVPGGMLVEPVFSVKTVNMASGNIRFEGSVKIAEDVSAGMSVHATGDIEVGGVAELASLEAGGNIVVKAGVIGGLGRKGAEGGVIRCGGNFEAGYAQNARIEAGDSIAIDDTAVNCELIAAKHILVGRRKRGCIVGGHHQATLSVTAKQIGSPQRTATRFEIGVNPAVHKHMLDLAQKRDALESQLLELAKLLDFAAKNPGRLPEDKVIKARTMAGGLNQQIAALRAEYLALDAQVALSQGARVVATDRIYEGVEVQLGSKRFRVPSEFRAVGIALTRKGELGLVPADGSEGVD